MQDNAETFDGRSNNDGDLLGKELVVGALLGALAGAVVGALLKAHGPGGGEEAPIRIKGGSIHLELQHPDQTWLWDDHAQGWMIDGGPRRQNTFYFDIEALGGCTKPRRGKTKTVVLRDADGTDLTVTQWRRKTLVTCPKALNLSNQNQTLSYDSSSADSYLQEITIGHTHTCRFTSRAEFEQMSLLDF